MPLSRRQVLAIGAAAPLPLHAEAWPSRPLRIIVPFGTGGSADVAARFLAEPLAARLGQPVVVENRPGGGAVIGTEVAAKATDGHTLLLMSNTHTANETLQPRRPYVLLRDLAPVAAISVAYHVLAVHPSLGIADTAGLIARAKAQPGQLDYASSGPGTPYHIAGAVFCAIAGIEMNHVPFKGSNEARTALISGQVPVMFDAIPTMREQIAAGRVIGLGTTGPEPTPLLPGLPTIAATVPGFEASIWLGLMMPAETPAPAIARVHEAVNQILLAPATSASMARGGATPMPMAIPDFAAFLRADIERQREWIRMARIEAG